jgi:hypothetical protein
LIVKDQGKTLKSKGWDARFMAEIHHAVDTEEPCDVTGCGKPAERSISQNIAQEAGLAVAEDLKRVHLCKEHYKAYKKATKTERKIGSMR